MIVRALLAALVVACGVGAGVAAVASSAVAEPTASRVLDRTFSCSVRLWAGARIVDVEANGGFRDPDRPSQWRWLPHASIGGRDISSYAWIVSGSPQPEPVGNEPVRAWNWIGVDAVRCKPARTKLPVSRRGLTGGAASQFRGSDEYDCTAASRILVRVTATLTRPVSLVRRRSNERLRYITPAGVPATSARLMVATAAGKPVALATVLETGKATLFVARGCVPT